MSQTPFTAYSQMVQSWVRACENWQAGLLAYQQAVATIQGQRARAIGHWWRDAPQYMQKCLTAGPTPTGLEAYMQWYGTSFCDMTHLACDITAQRAHLLKYWQHLATPGGGFGYAQNATPLVKASSPFTPSASTPSSTPATTGAATPPPAKAHTFTQTVSTPRPTMPKTSQALAANQALGTTTRSQQDVLKAETALHLATQHMTPVSLKAAPSKPRQSATVTVLPTAQAPETSPEPELPSNVTPLTTMRSEGFARPHAVSAHGGGRRGAVPRPARARTR